MKKYSVLVASALAAMAGFTSCDDKNECGCECSVPVINKVEILSDSMHADIKGAVEAGSYIGIQGSNLGEVVAIQFGDRVVNIKPAFRSANTLILQVPPVTKSCVGTLYTEKCPEGYTMNELSIIIGTPTVFMMYNEFVADGEWLKLRGSSFVGDQMQVKFTSDNGDTLIAQGADIQLLGNDGDQMNVKVPQGTGRNQNLVVLNAAEGKQSVCPIIFRDYRNMLFDFDEVQENMFQTGAIEKNADGIYTMEYSDEKFNWVKDAPKNYSTGEGNKFGVFQNAENYEGISFVPGKTTKTKPTVFGDFYKNGEVNAGNADSYVIKFELFVDKDFPTNMAVYNFGIVSGNDNTLDNSRAFSACFQGSKVNWIKGGEGGWEIPAEGGATDFYTDGWMTVSIPLSEIKWNFGVCNYTGFAQNISENAWDGTDPKQVYATSDMKTYVQENSAAFESDREMNNLFGGLVIQNNPWDCSFQASDQNKKAHVGIDNVRVVPNDGNGAIYKREKYGVSTQDFDVNPRVSAYLQ